MRLKARQTRFVCGSIGGWIVARLGVAGTGVAIVAGLGAMAGLTLLAPSLLRWPRPDTRIFRPIAAARGVVRVPADPARPAPGATATPAFVWEAPEAAPRLLRAAFGRIYPATQQAALRYAVFAPPGDDPDAPAPFVPRTGDRVAAPRPSRWAAEAYLFVRPGGGRASLAAAGQLGGSQAAARVTYRLDRDGPVRAALAARVYAPLHAAGAEAAVGLDWHPLPSVPLRLSVERRVALDHAGRDAWSAYAAGGFYKEPLPGVLVVDGYAQAGVVGLSRRDLFVDGALRLGHRRAIGAAGVTFGAGLWGAAQPAVARVDVGPRLGLVLPAADRTISLAVEGRLRVAGRAGPGSGAAMTLGVDL